MEEVINESKQEQEKEIEGKQEKENVWIKIAALSAFGVIIAMAGWVMENIGCIIAKGAIDCRFHFLPMIPEYALIPFAFDLLLGSADDLAIFGKHIFKKKTKLNKVFSNILCLVIICLAIYLGEEGVGNFMEMTNGAVLWDYTEMPTAFSKYTCALSVFGLGILSYLIFKFIFPLVTNYFMKKAQNPTFRRVFLTLDVLMIIDASIMIVTTMITGEGPLYWEIYFR